MSDAKSAEGKTASSIFTVCMGLFLLFVSIFLILLLVELWPVQSAPADGKAAQTAAYGRIFGFAPGVPPEMLYFLIAMVGGALGSYIHAATSFSAFSGKKALGGSWLWWYILRLPIGAILAFVFYAVIRAGFLAANTAVDSINPYGIVGLAGLVGMFSKQATEKLREVFDTMFKVADADKADKADKA